MKNSLKILVLALLALVMLLPMSALPVFAQEGDNTESGVVDEFEYETGYNRGYDGTKNGDGVLYAHGLDISVWQGENFNFEKAKKAGFSYVIIRAGVTYEKEGVYVTEEDQYFQDNYAGAKAAGLDVGVYFYSMAKTPKEAVNEAEALLGYIEGKTFEYPVYMDFEAPAVRTYLESDAARAKEICKAFMDRIAKEGYLAGMYSSASWIDSGAYNGWMGDAADELGEDYELWVACYFNDATYRQKGEEYSTRFGMYQYTSSKYISGYGGRLDANICYKDYPSIVKKYGFNGYEPDSSITVGGPGIVEESRFQLGKYIASTASSKVGLYTDPANSAEAVGYIPNKSVVEAIEACSVWGIDWAKVVSEDGLCGWTKVSLLKKYVEEKVTDEEDASEATENPDVTDATGATDADEKVTSELTEGESGTVDGTDARVKDGGCGASFGVGMLALTVACLALPALKRKK